MSDWVVVVRRGSNLNITLSTIYFDKWGSATKQPMIVVDNWIEGLIKSREQGFHHALFVDSGTVFVDWPEWVNLINNYPHQGLIGHIIWHPGKMPYLHSQCWFMRTDMSVCDQSTVTHPLPIRSEKNLHDNYTPLWIKPSSQSVSYEIMDFSQLLISDQLSQNLPVMNWNNLARDLKKFLYDDSSLSDLDDVFRSYISLAESQLWVLNNEKIEIQDCTHLLCPGSGLFWVLNLVSPKCKSIQIVDISHTQTKFCQSLWEHWSGDNYGQFVYEFISKNEILHYELDQADLDPLTRLKLKNPKRLIECINEKFQQNINALGYTNEEFISMWIESKKSKTLKIERGNLVDWVIEKQGLGGNDSIWTSNIMNYKWTMLHTTQERYDRFKELIK